MFENWSVDNFLDAFSIILAIIGGIFAYRQWSYANKTRRTELLNQIMEKLRFDKEMAETMYAIDYGTRWYDESFHNSNTDFEYKLDKLLSFLDYICYLKKEKHFAEAEFRILRYEVTRVCTSFQVQSYLWNLYHFSNKQGTTCSFQDLIDYGIDSGSIDHSIFKDKNSGYYPKYLNF
ncbi:MAG: hypothetical protein IJQ81_18415 [Oscillibacter sp.]|nr:hypothetical protein [Oscillibacter sp.]